MANPLPCVFLGRRGKEGEGGGLGMTARAEIASMGEKEEENGQKKREGYL